VYVKDLTTGDLILASTSDTGVSGSGDSTLPSLSDDGTKVAFHSTASDLDPADTDTGNDIFVKDLTTGDLTLASTSDTGAKSNGHSGIGTLSADGTRVSFLSRATNLDPADTDTGYDVYVKDLGTGDLMLASTSDTGVKGNNSATNPPLSSLSADGRVVAFHSSATNLDAGDLSNENDVYVKNLDTGDLTLASTSDTGVKGNGGSGDPSVSDDGTHVAFVSAATNFDAEDAPDEADIYVKDLITGDIMFASSTDAGASGPDPKFSPSLSADGDKVAFMAAGVLDPADGSVVPDVYVKDLTTGDITLASTSDTSVKGNGNSDYPSLSPGGTKVAFFSYATNFDPAASGSPTGDIFVKALPAVPTFIGIGGCSNGQSGTASVVDLKTYASRPLGCPASFGGTLGNDHPDQTPILLGLNPSLRIDWASGPDSVGVAKIKMGTTGTQWRAVLAIQASAGHDTPATNQYLPASGSGFTKTKLKGRLDWSALDSFNCASGIADPISWLDLVNNGSWIVKNA
jgi:Tol biopolymer transport system component